MTEAELVSVVLATSRASPFLSEAIQSLRGQTYGRWELIIVDNGAPPEAHIDRYAGSDPRINVVRADEKATVSVARNIGASHRSGSLLTFLDDDDRWHPSRLAKHVSVHRTSADAVASYSAYAHIDAVGARFGQEWRSRVAPASAMLRGDIPTPLGPTMVITSAAWNATGGFSSEASMMEDFELALRLASLGEVAYLDEVLFEYRRHSFNTTSTSPQNMRLRRAAEESILARHALYAAAREEHALANQLSRRLHAFRASQSREIGDAFPRLIRRHGLREAFLAMRWAVPRAPRFFARGLAKAFARAVGFEVQRR